MAAVNCGAGNAVGARTNKIIQTSPVSLVPLPLTGDPQLAENSRNLTLLVGGVGELGKAAKVGEVVTAGEKVEQARRDCW